MIFEKNVFQMYRSALIRRYDEDLAVFYYSHGDFEGLQAEDYVFPSAEGQMLRGSFYFYGAKRTDRLVIFEHGMGAGRRAYLKEIERLARAGHTVLAYDKTGCADSEGADSRCFSQALSDLDCCIRSLRRYASYGSSRIAVVGHSWGAYAALNIGALHPQLTHIVSLSGPISVEALLRQYFPGPLKLYIPSVLAFERACCPAYAELSAVDSLLRTEAKALILHSADDPMVKQSLHFDVLRQAMAGRDSIRFLLLQGKKHNPNYTAQAVAYKDIFSAEHSRAKKKGLLETEAQQLAFQDSFDFDRMTEQDESVWQEILTFLQEP